MVESELVAVGACWALGWGITCWTVVSQQREDQTISTEPRRPTSKIHQSTTNICPGRSNGHPTDPRLVWNYMTATESAQPRCSNIKPRRPTRTRYRKKIHRTAKHHFPNDLRIRSNHFQVTQERSNTQTIKTPVKSKEHTKRGMQCVKRSLFSNARMFSDKFYSWPAGSRTQTSDTNLKLHKSFTEFWVCS